MIDDDAIDIDIATKLDEAEARPQASSLGLGRLGSLAIRRFVVVIIPKCQARSW
jgi:hypothetical protein